MKPSEPRARLIFVSYYGVEAASFRFRVLKLAPALVERGFGVEILTGTRLSLLRDLAATLFRLRVSKRIVIFQKCTPNELARLAKGLGASVWFDVDDGGDTAIDGTPEPSDEIERVRRFVVRVDGVVGGSSALCRWLASGCPEIDCIPTCVDVENYPEPRASGHASAVIGWVGGRMAASVIPPIAQALDDAWTETGTKLLLVGRNTDGVLPDRSYVEHRPWRIDLEPKVFGEIDVGIMPLPDNDRARMKAGFKLLQYMAAGVPVVATPIGINRELVVPGENGFLAETPDEWRDALVRLARDPELRGRLGRNGRELVRSRYTMADAACQWEEVLVRRGVIEAA